MWEIGFTQHFELQIDEDRAILEAKYVRIPWSELRERGV